MRWFAARRHTFCGCPHPIPALVRAGGDPHLPSRTSRERPRPYSVHPRGAPPTRNDNHCPGLPAAGRHPVSKILTVVQSTGAGETGSGRPPAGPGNGRCPRVSARPRARERERPPPGGEGRTPARSESTNRQARRPPQPVEPLYTRPSPRRPARQGENMKALPDQSDRATRPGLARTMLGSGCAKLLESQQGGLANEGTHPHLCGFAGPHAG